MGRSAAIGNTLTRGERATFWILTAGCALTRLVSLARTPLDWDEMLFCLSLRDFDVTSHHPHPPGYPVYVALAKVVGGFGATDFHALQAVNVVAAMTLFPLTVAYVLLLGATFEIAIVAGSLLVFLPNVWFYGGTAFSDVPALALALVAIVLLLRARESSAAYVAAAVACAAAIGVRPQSALLFLWPAWLAVRRRRRSETARAAVIVVVLTVAIYAAAAFASGPLHAFVDSVRGQAQWVSAVDSWRNPHRASLASAFKTLFVDQYQSPALSIVITTFVTIGLLFSFRRDTAIRDNVLTFAPLALLSWLVLDLMAVARYSIAYAPMFAVLAAAGISVVSRGRRWIARTLAGAIAVSAALYALPAIRLARTSDAPPVAAIEAARTLVDPAKADLFVATGLVPHAQYFLADRAWVRLYDAGAIPLSATRPAWVVSEISDEDADRERAAGARVFTWPHGRLWNIERRRYFDVALRPVTRRATFMAGWMPAERGGHEEWRWMGPRAVVVVPDSGAEGRVHFECEAADVAIGRDIVVRLNGAVVSRRRAESWNIIDTPLVALRDSNALEISVEPPPNSDRVLRVTLLSVGAP